MNIDIERLKCDLINYLGAGFYSGVSPLMMEIIDVENASEEELIAIAKRYGFDLNKYIKGEVLKKTL